MTNVTAGEQRRREVAALYAATRGGVVGYLIALGLKPGAAEDVAQDAFLQLYTELRNSKEIREPRTWVYRVAHNLAINGARRAGAHLAGSDSAELTLPSREANAEEQLLERERADGFREAIGRLSERQRVCLELRCQGLLFRDIAEVLDIEISTAAEFVRRGIEELKKWNTSGSWHI